MTLSVTHQDNARKICSSCRYDACFNTLFQFRGCLIRLKSPHAICTVWRMNNPSISSKLLHFKNWHLIHHQLIMNMFYTAIHDNQSHGHHSKGCMHKSFLTWSNVKIFVIFCIMRISWKIFLTWNLPEFARLSFRYIPFCTLQNSYKSNPALSCERSPANRLISNMAVEFWSKSKQHKKFSSYLTENRIW